jgi:molecular chaperone GrpE
VTERDKGSEPRFRVTDRRRVARDAEGRSEEPSASTAAGASAVGSGEEAAARGADEATRVRDEELAAARAQAEEYRDHLQRLQAEFDNYRKRTLKEQSRMLELAAEPVVRRLLEVLDDFELALLHADQEPDFRSFLKGVELVYAKLLDALRAEGLERIEAEGKPFDPELHEALMQTGEGEGEPVVAEVFRPGYTLKGRVIRPAGVRVERS